MRLWDRLRGGQRTETRALSTVTSALQTGLPPAGSLPHDFQTYVHDGYQSNGIVFACILARMSLFVEAPYCFQQLGTGEKTFDNPEIRLLNFPTLPSQSVRKMRAQTEAHLSLAGNSYLVRLERDRGRLRRWRPDWVKVAYMEDDPEDVIGYVYWPGGYAAGGKPEVATPAEVAHLWTVPDALYPYRGMSWLTPVAREIDADLKMTDHKRRFFKNAATPNLLVKYQHELTSEQRQLLREELSRRFEGVENAYKTMVLDAGADVEAIGHSLEQMSFTMTKAAGETIIAAAAGVPPIVAGLKEGLQAATYSNYGQALRRFADGTMRQLWGADAAALDRITVNPTGARLWYDDAQIPALQQDKKDEADIVRLQALAIASLVRVGYDVDTIAAAVANGRLEELVHTGAIPNTLYLDPFVSADGDMGDDVERALRALQSAQRSLPSTT